MLEIIVRNSNILVDFIELKLRQGMPLEEAVIEAGAVRFRPILLTAAAVVVVVVGSAVMLFDMGQGPEGLVCPKCGADGLEREASCFASAAPSGSSPRGRFT